MSLGAGVETSPSPPANCRAHTLLTAHRSGCDPVVAVGECGLVDLITCAEGGSAPADSITADDTSATTTVCAAEQEACYEDSACLLCLQTLADEARAVVEVCHPPDYAGVEAPCSEKEEVACCFVEKGPECLSSDLFVAFTGGRWAYVLDDVVV